MKLSRRFKVLVLLCFLILVGAFCGFVAGYKVAELRRRNRGDLTHWTQAAVRTLEKLDPTPEQRQQFRELINRTADELSQTRQATLLQTQAAVDRLLALLEAELRPDQVAKFNELKPKKADVTLELLAPAPSQK